MHWHWESARTPWEISFPTYDVQFFRRPCMAGPFLLPRKDSFDSLYLMGDDLVVLYDPFDDRCGVRRANVAGFG